MTYGKAIAAVVYAILTAAYQIVSAGGGWPDAVGWVQIAIAGVTVASVWLVPITPRWPWAKSAVAAVLAALQVLTSVIVGGVTTDEYLMIALAVLSALGIYVAPAETDHGDSTVSVGIGPDTAV